MLKIWDKNLLVNFFWFLIQLSMIKQASWVICSKDAYQHWCSEELYFNHYEVATAIRRKENTKTRKFMHVDALTNLRVLWSVAEEFEYRNMTLRLSELARSKDSPSTLSEILSTTASIRISGSNTCEEHNISTRLQARDHHNKWIKVRIHAEI